MTDRGLTDDSCECYEAQRTDAGVPTNRAGLPTLRYRVGTRESFARGMNAALATKPALRRLATRSGADPTISLIDAWAATLDVLTFYQERIMNEGFLRTATEQRSVFELAATIGYRPSPGVAAETRLALEMDPTPGAPTSVTLESGIKVQTTPGPDEKAQTFETVEKLEARVAFNAMPVRRTVPVYPAVGAPQIVVAGVQANVQPGDLILLISEQRMLTGSGDWDVARVIAATPDAKNDRTTLKLGPGFGTSSSHSTTPPSAPVTPFVLRARASIFGSNAPDWRTLPKSTRDAIEGLDVTGVVEFKRTKPGTIQQVLLTLGLGEWPEFTIYAPNRTDAIDLEAIYPRVGPDSWAILSLGGITDLFRVTGVADASRSSFGISGKTTRLTLAGNLAPFAEGVRETSVAVQSEQLEPAEKPLTDPVQGSTIALASRVDGLEKDRLIVVTGKAPRVRVPKAGSPPSLQTPSGAVQLTRGESLRVTKPVAIAGSNATWTLLRDDGATGTLTANVTVLEPDEPRPTDPDIAESLAIASVADVSEVTQLALTRALTLAFDRATTVVRANLVRATHGESKRELLGGGDASVPFQAFKLNGKPLTFIQSSKPSGADPTLEVRVDDVTWKERESLYGANPTDSVFVTDRAGDGTTTIRFGDGRKGARVPTRAQNVVATYRVGTGSEGNVRVGQLDTLMSRPLGLKGVTNPLPATGGADPETLEDARITAPCTVLTLDRVVSLLDYQSFASGFNGIGKAQAAWVWDGHQRTVLVTVADSKGAAVPPETIVYLESSIRANSDPLLPFQVATYEPLTFTVSAGVFVDPAYLWDKVRAAIINAIATEYSFASRGLARPVFAAEVIALIQSVPGVRAVDLNRVSFTGTLQPPHGVLRALPARNDKGTLRPAQLIAIDPAVTAIDLKERA
jgi:predicted phage baseplate assembly protein